MQARDVKRRALELGVFLVPVLMLKTLGPLLGADAAHALGPKGIKTLSGATTLVVAEWTPEQLAAAEYLRTLDRKRIETPFKHGESAPVVTPDVEPIKTPDLLDAKVTMIMQTSGGGIALVGGQSCRVGSVVAGSWEVTAIDAVTRTVSFEHVDDGREAVRSLEQ
jgi:hypothetical protein